MGSLLPGGWDELRARNHALVLRGRAILCEALGAAPSPAPESMIGSLASVPLPPGPGPLPCFPRWPSIPSCRRSFDQHRIEVLALGLAGVSGTNPSRVGPDLQRGVAVRPPRQRPQDDSGPRDELLLVDSRCCLSVGPGLDGRRRGASPRATRAPAFRKSSRPRSRPTGA